MNMSSRIVGRKIASVVAQSRTTSFVSAPSALRSSSSIFRPFASCTSNNLIISTKPDSGNFNLSIRCFSDAQSSKKDNAEQPPPPPPPKAADDVKEEGTAEEETAATEEDVPEPTPREIELEKQVKELKDQLLRSLAEQDNTRRIAQRDVEQARNFAIDKFAKSLLDVSDNLQRAIDAVDTEDLNESTNPKLVSLYEGIEMTIKNLTKAFTTNGLIQYGTIGESFDPNIHDALLQYPDPTKEPNTIGQVIKVGYKLNNRVLRSAQVGVIQKQ